jgi:hypothetical protein
MLVDRTKNKDRQRATDVDGQCTSEKECPRYIPLNGSCLFKDKKLGRCMIIDDLK